MPASFSNEKLKEFCIFIVQYLMEYQVFFLTKQKNTRKTLTVSPVASIQSPFYAKCVFVPVFRVELYGTEFVLKVYRSLSFY